jgi:hypothetical protein
VILFNSFVDKIEGTIDLYLNKMREVDLTRGGLLDFGDFFDIVFDQDGSQQVYPDVYDEIQKTSTDKKEKIKGTKK